MRARFLIDGPIPLGLALTRVMVDASSKASKAVMRCNISGDSQRYLKGFFGHRSALASHGCHDRGLPPSESGRQGAEGKETAQCVAVSVLDHGRGVPDNYGGLSGMAGDVWHSRDVTKRFREHNGFVAI